MKRIGLWETTEDAWHAALATREGMQDPFTDKGPSGTRGGDFIQVREAESRRVLKAIKALPERQHVCGMWCFGIDDSTESIRARNKILQFVWRHVQSFHAPELYYSFDKSTKLLILTSAAVHSAQLRARGADKKSLSDAEVASRLGINPSSFLRTWKEAYDSGVDLVECYAREALTEVGQVVSEINRKYGGEL